MKQSSRDFLALMPLFQKIVVRMGAVRTLSKGDQEMTYLQMGVLGSVANRGTPTMGQIAEDNFITPPAATRIVGDLVEKGLLERLIDPADRRVVRVGIRDGGRSALKQAHAEAAHMLAQIVAAMTEPDRRALYAGLSGFLKAAAALDEIHKGERDGPSQDS